MTFILMCTIILIFGVEDACGDDIHVLIQKGKDQNYYKYVCGNTIYAKETEDVTFFIPNDIYEFRCLNTLGNIHLNMTKQNLIFTRYYKATVNEVMDGSWLCSVSTIDLKQQACFETKCWLTFSVHYVIRMTARINEKVVAFEDNSTENIVNMKEADAVKIWCSLPKVNLTTLTKGSLKWRHRVHNGKKYTEQSVTNTANRNMLQVDYEPRIEDNGTIMECVFTNTFGYEILLKTMVLVTILPEPRMTISGDAAKLSGVTYEGRVGESVLVSCSTPEDRPIAFYWVLDDEYIEEDKNVTVSSKSISLRFKLTADHDKMQIFCCYRNSTNWTSPKCPRLLFTVQETAAPVVSEPRMTISGDAAKLSGVTYEGRVGESVLVSCSTPEDRPIAFYWVLDDEYIEEDTNVTISSKSISLRFKLTADHDKMQIFCCYRNSTNWSSPKCPRLLFTVQETAAPVVSEPRMTISGDAAKLSGVTYEGRVGESVLVSCSTPEDRPIAFYWVLDDEYMEEDKNVTVSLKSISLRFKLTADHDKMQIFCCYRNSTNWSSPKCPRLLFTVQETAAPVVLAPARLKVNGRSLEVNSQNVSSFESSQEDVITLRCDGDDNRPMSMYLCEDICSQLYSNSNSMKYSEVQLDVFKRPETFIIKCNYRDKSIPTYLERKVAFKVKTDRKTFLSNAPIICGILIFTVVFITLTAYWTCRKIRTRPALELPGPTAERETQESHEEHIYYTLNYGEEYSYARPDC